MAEYIIQDTTLTAIGDAIRAKTGGTELITPENMPTEIESIQSGTKEILKEKDFNFYDYDGTLLYSYTREEVLQLTELPPLPSQPGLICQGWNWTLEQIKGEANENWYADVGAIYITDDGKTRIYITTPENDFMGYMSFQLNGSAKLNWGDGSDEIDITNNNTNTLSFSHNYVNSGDYIITIEVTSGTLTIKGDRNRGSYLMTDYDKNILYKNNYFYHSAIKKFEGGTNCNYTSNAFYCCTNMETATLPQGSTITDFMFYSCNYLKAFIVPMIDSSSEHNLTYTFNLSNNLQIVSLPQIKNIKNNWGGCAFSQCGLKRAILPMDLLGYYNIVNGCTCLSDVKLPPKVESVGNDFFMNCYLMKDIIIPNTTTSIGTSAFSQCYTLTKIYIPDSVTSINNNAFYYCCGVKEYDFTDFSLVTAEDGTKYLPITFGTNVFQSLNTNCKILFADAETAEVAKATTNLAQYADYIHYVGETEATS